MPPQLNCSLQALSAIQIIELQTSLVDYIQQSSLVRRHPGKYLQVPMEHAFAVAEVHRIHQLLEVSACLIFGELALMHLTAGRVCCLSPKHAGEAW